jgi:hypothetical protein
MRKVILASVFVITASVICFGQLQNMVTTDAADDSKLLKTAKTVAVFIDVGKPVDSQGALYIPDFVRAKKQVSEKLSKAGLVAVANPTSADIVIVVHEVNEGETQWADKKTICLGDKLDVFKGGKVPSESDTPIFTVNEYCGISWPLNRAMDKLINAIKK